MEVGASTVINEAAASCSQSPANSSAALPAAVVPACSAASPKAVQEDEQKGSERTGVEAGVPNTPEKLMQTGTGLVQIEPQFFQVAAVGDGSSSSAPDLPHQIPAALEGPFYFCANPMASVAMNSPFTPQRLPALQALQTPMQMCMAPVMVAFQAAYPMGPNGPMAAYPVMAQAAMAQANAAAAAAAAVTAPVQHAVQQQSQQLSASESQPEVSPDVIARFEAGLRTVMTQPFSDTSSDPSAGDSSTTGAAVGSNQWTQSSTGFKGVTKHKRTKRYEAHIWGHKQQVYLGSFDLGVQAARAHDIMALCNHGGVVYPGSQNALNFPPSVYSELLPFLGHLSQGDVLTALRNFGKKTPAARRAAAAAAAPVAPVERKRKSESSPQRATRSVSNNPVAMSSKRQAVAASSEGEAEAEDADAEEAAALLHHFASGR